MSKGIFRYIYFCDGSLWNLVFVFVVVVVVVVTVVVSVPVAVIGDLSDIFSTWPLGSLVSK